MLRERVARALDGYSHNSPVSKWLNLFLIALIILNVLAIIFESVASFYAQYGEWLYRFEIFSVVIFTAEYLMRVWSCVELDEKDTRSHLRQRLSYMSSPLAVIDLVAILPFYLQFFVVMDLRFIRVVRILRVFKLTRYNSAMRLLYNVFKEERHSLVAAFSVLFVILVISSSGIYLIEHDIQPEKFGSIPAAMWWAMATLTTVGYGDVTPVTAAGKLFGGLITIASMGMVALPTGILVSGFADQLRRRRQKFTALVRHVLDDGVITESEWGELDKLRQSLDLDDEEAALLMQLNGIRNNVKETNCPHCHKPLRQVVDRRNPNSSSPHHD